MRDILPLLKNVENHGDYYTARCPAHGDEHSSLSVKFVEGKVLLKCHALCKTEDIVSKLGLSMSDLFEDKAQAPASPPRPKDAKPEAEYVYTDERGNVVHKTIRYGKQWDKPFAQARPDPDNPGRWICNLKGIETVLYRLPELIEAVKARKPILICEGEKDCDNLAKLGFTSTTNPMGAGKWRESYNKYLAGADVIILGDNDDTGWHHVRDVAHSLHNVAASVRIVDLVRHYPDMPTHGDITDLLKSRAKTTGEAKALISSLMDKSVIFEDFEAFENSNEWPDITPFDTLDTPAFPVDALPPPLADYVNALSEFTQTPPEMSGLLSLGILSTAFQGRYEVEVIRGIRSL